MKKRLITLILLVILFLNGCSLVSIEKTSDDFMFSDNQEEEIETKDQEERPEKNEGTVEIIEPPKLDYKIISSLTDLISEVELSTIDGYKIQATHYKSEQKSDKTIILLHMLNRDRTDWNEFAISLQSNNYNVLTIDLRGHGQSTGDWTLFKAQDFNDMIFDLEAAKYFLSKSKMGSKEISIVGASIGANTAVNYAAYDKDIKSIVLLSPGENYKGISTFYTISQCGVMPILFIVSNEDTYAFESTKTLYTKSIADKQLKVYSNAGHGTDMFNKEAEMSDFIIDWLNQKMP